MHLTRHNDELKKCRLFAWRKLESKVMFERIQICENKASK
jgi:hypothetical protein